ncbi:TetR/AcrR family transcriptional regulator [Streptomyces niveiscabiei]|uniref:TetR/AcrR family transcriptional regulator n=1 Tax=Streptomyces niveiscabiei TaxID=164115 RepID=UPI0029BB76CD|nr:TetR/AcrR family transcriptional regulator [Streptomyces niveiscabiei]MDX3384747.1 TetR/AcrR family transcriptional regulator [Streptomyces niveiscabiei]
MAVRRTRITPLRAAQVYEAVLALLREVGYEALTMEAVAARVRAGKATLYRQWGGKPQLVVAALAQREPLRITEVDTGSLPGDLYEIVDRVGDEALSRGPTLHLGAGSAILGNPELRRSLRRSMLEPALADLATVLRRAVRRGEVPGDCPALGLVPGMLLSVVLARPLLGEEPLTVVEMRRHLDALVFPALGLCPAPACP